MRRYTRRDVRLLLIQDANRVNRVSELPSHRSRWVMWHPAAAQYLGRQFELAAHVFEMLGTWHVRRAPTECLSVLVARLLLRLLQ